MRQSFEESKKAELIEWVEAHKNDEALKAIFYASQSFKKQRSAMHDFISELNKEFPEVLKKVLWTKYVICGMGDDTTGFIMLAYPDFKDKFYKGISIRDIENIFRVHLMGWSEEQWSSQQPEDEVEVWCGCGDKLSKRSDGFYWCLGCDHGVEILAKHKERRAS